MSGRLIAIGDVHGCSAALSAVLAAADPQPEDTVVTLGDYVDRGPDARGTLELLRELAGRCRLVPLMGNHEEMLLGVLDGTPGMLRPWLFFGGRATLASYGTTSPKDIPAEDVDFIRECVSWHETDEHFFVHGSYVATLPMDEQPTEVTRWEALRNGSPGPHQSGKIAIVGHTAQKHGEILDRGYLKCIDTCVYGGGWLTALDIGSGDVWQASSRGKMRR